MKVSIEKLKYFIRHSKYTYMYIQVPTQFVPCFVTEFATDNTNPLT